MKSLTKRIAALSIATASLTGVAVLGATAPASAGTNGQQLKFCSDSRVAYGWAFATGRNQLNQPVQYDMPLGKANSCVLLANWWWRGNVTINWYDQKGTQIYHTSANVPFQTDLSDVYPVYA